MDVVFSALLWTTVSTVIAQAAAILVMWLLGLPPSKLRHEIEDAQNPAVGASFFMIALIAAIFINPLVTEGFTVDDTSSTIAWIAGGLALALVYTLTAFYVAYRVLVPIEGENLYRYIQRELIAEQNASLAFVLGGLAIAPFTAVVFQIM